MEANACNFEAFVLVNGRPVTEVTHNENTYIEGRKGSEFTLRVKNNTWKRILVVPSVDGLNTLDGESCGIDSRGYVVDARGTIDIPGWTLDDTAVGKFIFKSQGAPEGTRRQTYAEAMGQGENQGVIGFMIFQEKQWVYPGGLLKKTFCPPPKWGNGYGPYGSTPGTFDGNTVIGSSTLKSNVTFGNTSEAKGDPDFDDVLDAVRDCLEDGANSVRGISNHQENYSAEVKGCVEPEPSLGAGMGREVDFQTHTVQFERDSTQPHAVFVFHYDTIQNLKRKGVPTHLFRPAPPQQDSNPFPASPDVHKPGCKLPPGYRRRK